MIYLKIRSPLTLFCFAFLPHVSLQSGQVAVVTQMSWVPRSDRLSFLLLGLQKTAFCSGDPLQLLQSLVRDDLQLVAFEPLCCRNTSCSSRLVLKSILRMRNYADDGLLLIYHSAHWKILISSIFSSECWCLFIFLYILWGPTLCFGPEHTIILYLLYGCCIDWQVSS